MTRVKAAARKEPVTKFNGDSVIAWFIGSQKKKDALKYMKLKKNSGALRK